MTVATANSWLFDAVYSKTGGAISVGSGQTQRWNVPVNSSGDQTGGSTKLASSTGSTTMQWTYSAADDYVQSVVAIKPASSGGGSSSTYTYDAAGNMTSDGTKCYEYNEANQMKKAKTCSGSVTIAEYIYDYNGNRMVKKNYTSGTLATTVYSWSDAYETKIIVGGSTESTVYYFVNNELIAKKDNRATRTYIHNDHLGSTSVITNSGGTLVEQTKYDPWGEVLSGGTVSKFLYTGQEKDGETGLNYYNFRYYNSQIRRFIQPDDVIQNILNPQMLNRYSYVRNNPMKYTDPTGHVSILDYNKALTQYNQKPNALTYNSVLTFISTLQSKSGNNSGSKNAGYHPERDNGEARDIAKPIFDHIYLNDYKTIKNPNTTAGQKAWATIGLISNIPIFGELKILKEAKVADEVINTSKMFNADQAALVDLAKEAKRSGISVENASTLVEWAKEVGLPFHDIMTHPAREFGQFPHINIGPIKHIFID